MSFELTETQRIKLVNNVKKILKNSGLLEQSVGLVNITLSLDANSTGLIAELSMNSIPTWDKVG